jgi:hypothetical protein
MLKIDQELKEDFLVKCKVDNLIDERLEEWEEQFKYYSD